MVGFIFTLQAQSYLSAITFYFRFKNRSYKMQSTAEKLYPPVFSRKPEPIKLFKSTPEEICFSCISKMIYGRIKRDANLLMSVGDFNAHI
jgi:hypothetical protein